MPVSQASLYLIIIMCHILLIGLGYVHFDHQLLKINAYHDSHCVMQLEQSCFAMRIAWTIL